MKRLLLVSYEFPPKGGTQSQHVAKLARGLTERGWDVTALTVADPPTAMLDEGLWAEVADQVRIVTAWSLEPTRVLQALRRLRGGHGVRSGHGAAGRPGATGLAEAPPVLPVATEGGEAGGAAGGTRSYSGLPLPVIRAIQSLFFPDEKVGWAGPAVRVANRLHAHEAFDAVLAVGPPFTGVLVGLRLHQRLGLPLVADLRDPVVGNYFYRPRSERRARRVAAFERAIVEASAAVLVPTPTMRNALAERYPDRASAVHVVPNGFDPRDVAAFEAPADRRVMTIAYVGAFQGEVMPGPFLEGLRRARERDPRFADSVRVRFVGPPDAESERLVREAGLGDVVERVGFVPHAAAVGEMVAADVLLLLMPDDPRMRGVLTSKLPEYMGAGRAVLGVVPEGDAADVIRRAGAGRVVSPSDPDAIAEALLGLYDDWLTGSLPTPDAAVVAEFDRNRITDRVSALLEEAVRPREPGEAPARAERPTIAPRAGGSQRAASASPPRRRILFVNNFPGPSMGGGEVLLLHVIRGCISAGWQVTVLCPPGAELGVRAADAGASVFVADMGLRSLVPLVSHVRRLAAEADLVEGTGYFTNLVVRLAAVKRRGDVVVNLVAVEPFARTPESGGVAQRLARRLADALTRSRVDAFLAVCASVARSLEASGVPRSRVHVVRNGVDAGALQVAASVPLTVALPEGEGPLVGCVARLEPVKGVEHFVDAAVHVAARRPDARFVVAGSGSQATALAARLPQGLHRRFTFLGDVRPIEPLMGALDVLVLPSLAEGLPTVLLEAAALGVPVVASDVGGVPEVVDDGVTGLVVPPADARSIALAVLDLLEDPERARAMGRAARERVEAVFSVERMVEETISVYERYAGGAAWRTEEQA